MNIECRALRPLLDRYLSRDLDPELNERVVSHLAACTECGAIVETNWRVKRALRRAWDAEAPPRDLAARIQASLGAEKQCDDPELRLRLAQATRAVTAPAALHHRIAAMTAASPDFEASALNCAAAAPLIQQYVSREIDTASRASLLDHLDTCESCAGEISLYTAARDRLQRAFKPLTAPPYLAARIRAGLTASDRLNWLLALPWKWAGAAALLAIAIWIPAAMLKQAGRPAIPMAFSAPPASHFADLAEPLEITAGQLADISPSPLLRQAAGHFGGRDLAAAALAARQALKDNPKDLGAMQMLALVEYAKGNWAEALALSKKAHAYSDHSPAVWQCWITLQLALLGNDLGRIKDECADLEEHAAQYPRAREILRQVRLRTRQLG